MKKIIDRWYELAVFIGAFFGLLLYLGNWDLRMATLLAGTMFIHLHFFEEFECPGGFPWIGMQVEMHETECHPESWDLNNLSACYGNEWFALLVYILPMFVHAKFLTLAAVLFAFAELLMHLVVFNIALKRWYNPGLLSVLIGLLPVSLNYLIHTRSSYSLIDILLALVWIIFNYWMAFRSPIYKKLGRKKAYSFSMETAMGKQSPKTDS